MLLGIFGKTLYVHVHMQPLPFGILTQLYLLLIVSSPNLTPLCDNLTIKLKPTTPPSCSSTPCVPHPIRSSSKLISPLNWSTPFHPLYTSTPCELYPHPNWFHSEMISPLNWGCGLFPLPLSFGLGFGGGQLLCLCVSLILTLCVFPPPREREVFVHVWGWSQLCVCTHFVCLIHQMSRYY